VFFRGVGVPFFFLFGLAPIALGVIALVDATRRTDDEWARANQSKTLWVVLIAVGFVLCAIGLVIDLVYLLSIRPQLDRAAPSYPAAGVPAAPQAGWYPDPYARHEQRWFDGFRWTEHVSDAGAPSADPVS
jgi:Protein of unknown function (DUF2510)/Protein of unknown function (DUF2516)